MKMKKRIIETWDGVKILESEIVDRELILDAAGDDMILNNHDSYTVISLRVKAWEETHKDKDGNIIKVIRRERTRTDNTLYDTRLYLSEESEEYTERLTRFDYDYDFITLKEWAIKNGIKPDTARQKANRGGFETAVKMGRDWMIKADEEPRDLRKKDK